MVDVKIYPIKHFYRDAIIIRVANQGNSGTSSPWGKTDPAGYQNENCFSAITKNLNWEILTKNLVTFKVTFKRWDGVKKENFNIMGLYWKMWFLGGGGCSWKPMYREIA